MIHDPYVVEPRKPLSPKQKLRMFIEQSGICCICGHKINGVKEAWDEHVNPLWLNGDNSAPNRSPAHNKCARAKSGAETTQRAKIRSTAEKHFGAKKQRSSLAKKPGTRFDWSKGRYTRVDE